MQLAYRAIYRGAIPLCRKGFSKLLKILQEMPARAFGAVSE
jgi:hypothetical protein